LTAQFSNLRRNQGEETITDWSNFWILNRPYQRTLDLTCSKWTLYNILTNSQLKWLTIIRNWKRNLSFITNVTTEQITLGDKSLLKNPRAFLICLRWNSVSFGIKNAKYNTVFHFKYSPNKWEINQNINGQTCVTAS